MFSWRSNAEQFTAQTASFFFAGDGTVDTADVDQTSNDVGQKATQVNFREDVTADGFISNGGC